MNDLIEFLKEQFPNKELIITGSQHDRTWDVDTYKPENDEEFKTLVEKAPFKLLKEFGFGIWAKMSDLVKENSKKPVKEEISIPIINAPGENFTLDVGRGDAPTEIEGEDKYVILIPGEWYNHIPDGYLVTFIDGLSEPFQKGKTDDDIRYGMLAFGVQRSVTEIDNEKK